MFRRTILFKCDYLMPITIISLKFTFKTCFFLFFFE
uniref:Uncharacterized protein n=1 Tax=Rhizophora mucronata TaxID=61149 RepID=A0A2P2NLG3_RHIMU